jgi:hypothetical protein
MKRNTFLVALMLVVFGTVLLRWTATPAAADPPPAQPVFVYLTTSFSDVINHDISDARLRHLLPLLEKYRKQYPSLSATIYFSGAMTADLQRRNSETHLLDEIKRLVKQGVIQAGYDGSQETSDEHHAMLELSHAKTPEERWLKRVQSAEEVLTTARNPLTGAVLPGKTGGLKKMQEVLGPAAAIRGVTVVMPNAYSPMAEVGSDSEIVHVIRRYNKTAILPGLTDADVGHVGSYNYLGWAESLSMHLSPSSDTPPELYWQEDALRSSETSGDKLRFLHASDGPEKVKPVFEQLNRSRIRIVHVEIASDRIFAKNPGPPTPMVILPFRYALQHPTDPKYPARLRFSPAEIDAGYAADDAVMNYLVSEFFPKNPGSGFVSNTDLKQMTPAGWGYDLPVASLQQAVNEKLKAWGDHNAPPANLFVDGHYLSDADMFEVMADTLAQKGRHSGKLPVTVKVARVYGPIRTGPDQQPPVTGEVTVADVEKACAGMLPALHDDSWSALPHNAIPSQVTLNGITINPAQFLRLMAEAFGAPSPETKLRIKPMGMFWGREAIFYRRRSLKDMGTAWTYKPAPVGHPSVQGGLSAKKSAD